jgi:hypothetical protein
VLLFDRCVRQRFSDRIPCYLLVAIAEAIMLIITGKWEYSYLNQYSDDEEERLMTIREEAAL